MGLMKLEPLWAAAGRQERGVIGDERHLALGDAQRHVEGFEFLFACAWQEMLAKT